MCFQFPSLCCGFCRFVGLGEVAWVWSGTGVGLAGVGWATHIASLDTFVIV